MKSGLASMRNLAISAVILIALTGCTNPRDDQPNSTSELPLSNSPESSLEPTATYTLPPATLALEQSAEPQRIEFQSTDGTPLVGTFWPSAESQATAILLMHWNPGTKEDWLMLAALLQGQVISQPSGESSRPSYAVFAFDFR